MSIAKDDLIKYYYIEELLNKKIAQIANCHPETLRQKRKLFKLPHRDREWTDNEFEQGMEVLYKVSNGLNIENDMRKVAGILLRRTSSIKQKMASLWLKAFAPQALSKNTLEIIEDVCVPQLKIRKINCDAYIPEYSTHGAVGLDLRAVSDYNIKANNHEVVWTGIAMMIPYGFVGMVCPRSGLAAKDGLTVLNAPGIIDPDYRGDNDEVGVILYNTGSKHDIYNVKKGDKVAQLVLVPSPRFEIIEVEKLDDGDRGGFGSTGK